MAQSYTRQSTFADGDTITASLFNNEYNQLLNAFAYSSSSAATTGHRHDGTAAQGGNIPQIGDLDFNNKIVVDATNNRWGVYVEVSGSAVEQIRIQDGAIVPVTNNDIDLGTSSLEFKDLFLDGTAHVDTLDVDVNATVAGTLGVTGATTLSSDLSVGGNLTVTGSATIAGNLTFGDAASDTVAFSADVASNLLPSADNTYDLGASGSEWKDLYIDGTANIDSLVADTADINGGTIDGATIATSDITVGSGKTLNVSAGTLTLADNQISGDKVEGGTIAATTITTLTSTTGNITSVNATTVDTTNLEVTTLKAKDGTAAGSIADSTGVVTLASSVLTTTDINGGTIDGVTIGGSSAGDITYANLSDGTITITAFVDEDDMSSNSATLVPTQQSVKAYVDAQVTAQDFDFSADTGGSLSIDLDSEAMTFTGGTGIDTSGLGNAVTFAIDSTVTTLTGSQTLTNKVLTSPDINTPDIDGGTIDGTVIGGLSAAAITGTVITGSSLDISGDADIDGTLEADAITVNGTALGEVIADTVGAMVSSNTETNITVTYEDSDNTLDFVIGTLNQDTTGNAATATALETARTIGGVSFDGTANITPTTFTTATFSGDVNVDSGVLFVDVSENKVGINQSSPDVSLDLGSNTDAVHVPVGTTAQRPGSAAAGYFRYNTSLSQFEGYTDAWGAIGGGGTNTFTHDVFTCNGSTTAFTLSQSTESENNLIVFVDGVFQEQSAYSIATSGGVTTLTMSAAPANGRKLVVYTVAAGVSGSNLNIDTMTGDGSDTTLTLSINPVNENNTQVFIDGVYQSKANYSISGTTLTFSTAPPTGSSVEVMTMTQTDINVPVDGTITSAKLSGDLTLPGDLNFADSNKAIFGAGSDLQIYHDASDSVILDNGTGNLKIQANDLVLKNADGSKEYLKGTDGGSVRVRYNNTTVLETTATGIDVTGTVTASDMTLSDSTNPTLTITDTTTPTSLALTAGNLSTTIGTTTDHPLKFETNGTERLRIENDGNVGIGTASPSYALHVYETPANGAYSATTNMVPTARFHATESTTGAYTAIQLSANNANSALGWWNIGTVSTSSNYDNHLVFQSRTGASTYAERMRIDSSGQVGIGTTSPSTSLDIVRNGVQPLRIQSTSGTEVAINMVNTGGNVQLEAHSGNFNIDADAVGIGTSSPNAPLEVAGAATTSTDIAHFSNSNGVQKVVIGLDGEGDGQITLIDAGNNTDVLFTAGGASYINTGGNFGIGTDSPSELLEVHSTGATAAIEVSAGTASSTTGEAKLVLRSLHSSSGTSYSRSEIASLGVAGGDSDLIFRTTTTSSGPVEHMRLDASGNLLVGTTSVINTGKVSVVFAGASGNGISLKTTTASNGSKFLSFANSGGTEIGYIEENTNSSVNYSTSSDQRLKENIVDAPSASDDIDAIQVRSFDWKVNGSHQKYGMVAQELQTVAPEAVSGNADSEKMMGVDYSKLVPMLVKEIQSLRARVAQLES